MTRRTHDGDGAGPRAARRPAHPDGRTAPARAGRRGFAARAAGTAAVALLAAACGGSSKPAAAPSTTATTATTSTTTSSPTTPAPTSTPAPTTSSTPAPGGTAPADPAAATAQIKQNWTKFFSASTPVSEKAKYLENGDKLAPLLQGFATDPRVAQVTATVSDVTFTSPTTATVTYSLSLQGQVVAPNATGKAVLEDGTWKIADSTLCGLLALTGTTSLPGC